MGLVLYALLCLAPVTLIKLAMEALAAWSRYTGSKAPAPTGADKQSQCVRYRATLRRLAIDHDRLLSGNAPAKAARLRAVQLAYDDTLLQACAVLEVDAPPRPLDTVSRIQIEAELVTHGFSW
jgi:hypothetical protein